MQENNALPRHVGIIMDGNGRWAQKQGAMRVIGHKFGTETVRTAITFCCDKKIEVLTLYAFSTENWKRPQDEVDDLMNLVTEYLTKETPEMKQNNIVLSFPGDIAALPAKSKNAILDSINETKDNTGLKVNIALNYGARAEMTRAAKLLINDVLSGKIEAKDITEEMFAAKLYTAGQPDPDLIIRTAGETRLSNFLLWQAAYSEFYFTETYWPDFDEKEFQKALDFYAGRKRRFGGL